MATLEEIRDLVIGQVRDEAGKLANPEDFDRNISAALKRYSKHRPGIAVVDIEGNGTQEYALPNGWVSEYSAVRGIEYPIGNVPASMIESDDHEVYQSPSGQKLRLLKNTPSAAESFRVAFTTLRTAPGIPEGDVDAFAWLAAALCCEELANAYAQSMDSSIAADAVDYKDKSYKYAQRAKRLMQLYKEHLGLREDDLTTPASAVTDLDIGYPGGGDRLTHPRRERKRR